MSITQYLDELISQLAQQLNIPLSSFEIGRLNASPKCIAIRLMPNASTHYYDGNRGRKVTFQALVKDTTQRGAVNTIEALTEALSSLQATIYAEPSYLQQDEQGYIYTSAFTADID